MSMTTIRVLMEKIIDMPVVFLLLTVLVFGIMVVCIATAAYFIACARSKSTEMTGIMRVGVELNSWCGKEKEDPCQDTVRLDYGKFWVSMKDPANEVKNRLDKNLDWKEQAFCRQYEVRILLSRFLAAYKKAGFHADPSADLLEGLLEQENFCRALGKCSYQNAKKGLTVTGNSAWKQDPNKRKVSVCQKIDGTAFYEATGCEARTICVTLEYQE